MKAFRLIILVCFALFLLIHILFTLLYVLPENLVAPAIKASVGRYTNPLFDQGWALFAEVPEVNKKVYVSYQEADKKWSAWEDPFQVYVSKHQSNRFTANGKIVLMISSTLHYIHFDYAELLKTNKVIRGDTTSGYYKVLKYEVNHALALHDKHPGNVRLIVECTNANCANKQIHYIYFP
jgi:hypothetical protein